MCASLRAYLARRTCCFGPSGEAGDDHERRADDEQMSRRIGPERIVAQAHDRPHGVRVVVAWFEGLRSPWPADRPVRAQSVFPSRRAGRPPWGRAHAGLGRDRLDHERDLARVLRQVVYQPLQLREAAASAAESGGQKGKWALVAAAHVEETGSMGDRLPATDRVRRIQPPRRSNHLARAARDRRSGENDVRPGRFRRSVLLNRRRREWVGLLWVADAGLG